MSTNNSEKHAYFVGGGLASLAGAVYLLEDGGFKGENIHIIEALPILGGSNDGAGSKEKGFICRGGRMRLHSIGAWRIESGCAQRRLSTNQIHSEMREAQQERDQEKPATACGM